MGTHISSDVRELKRVIRSQIVTDARENHYKGLNFIVNKALDEHLDKFIFKYLGGGKDEAEPGVPDKA